MSVPQNSAYGHYLKSLNKPTSRNTDKLPPTSAQPQEPQPEKEEEVTFLIPFSDSMASQVQLCLFHGNQGDRADLWLRVPCLLFVPQYLRGKEEDLLLILPKGTCQAMVLVTA